MAIIRCDNCGKTVTLADSVVKNHAKWYELKDIDNMVKCCSKPNFYFALSVVDITDQLLVLINERIEENG